MGDYRIAPPRGARVTLGELGVIPRILLATDGTLTHILEAYADELVQLVKLSQSLVTEPEDRLPFGLAAGERALRRVILLRGSTSGATFIHADSVVMLDRLPEGVADALLTTERPIGKLLAERRTETFREISGAWEECHELIAAHFGLTSNDPLLARTYRIVSGGRPIAWITETFPEKFQVAVRVGTGQPRDRGPGPILAPGFEHRVGVAGDACMTGRHA